MGAAAQECDGRYAESPQYAAEECKFQNPPNPQAKPHRSTWDIYMRFIVAKKEGTVPMDPIPVRKLERAELDALDAASNWAWARGSRALACPPSASWRWTGGKSVNGAT